TEHEARVVLQHSQVKRAHVADIALTVGNHPGIELLCFDETNLVEPRDPVWVPDVTEADVHVVPRSVLRRVQRGQLLVYGGIPRVLDWYEAEREDRDVHSSEQRGHRESRQQPALLHGDDA